MNNASYAAVAALVFCSATAQADLIDNFGPVTGEVGPNTDGFQSCIGNCLGDERDISHADIVASSGAPNLAGTTSSGALFNDNGTDGRSTVVIQWDGADGSMARQANGLGAAVFTPNTTGLEFIVDTVDIASSFAFQLDIYDQFDALAASWVNGSNGPFVVMSGDPSIAFPMSFSEQYVSAVATPLGGWDTSSADLLELFTVTGLGAIELTITTEIAATDFSIDEFRQTTPSPATIALFGIGLVGLAAARRRKT